jgi:predicted patatin/cPLA2 family phospholipase
MSKKILVLKGGGARGLVQASCIYELEKQGMDLKEFDLIVGTSVGAINGSCIALGKTGKELFDMYPTFLDKIFQKPWYPKFPKYDRKNFVKVYLDLFGWKKMKDSLTDFIVTSVYRCENRTHYFKSWEEKDGNENMVNILIRTFAAPMYFGQLVDNVNKKVWIDGGCTIDNLPLDIAFTEIILEDWLNESAEFTVIGTGFSDYYEPFEKAKKSNTISQVFDFLSPSDGGMARVSSSFEQVRKLKKISEKYTNIKINYYDVMFDKKFDVMDGVKFKKEYINFGVEMARKPFTTF